MLSFAKKMHFISNPFFNPSFIDSHKLCTKYASAFWSKHGVAIKTFFIEITKLNLIAESFTVKSVVELAVLTPIMLSLTTNAFVPNVPIHSFAVMVRPLSSGPTKDRQLRSGLFCFAIGSRLWLKCLSQFIRQLTDGVVLVGSEGSEAGGSVELVQFFDVGGHVVKV